MSYRLWLRGKNKKKVYKNKQTTRVQKGLRGHMRNGKIGKNESSLWCTTDCKLRKADLKKMYLLSFHRSVLGLCLWNSSVVRLSSESASVVLLLQMYGKPVGEMQGQVSHINRAT